jgi:hypothetical protein
MKTAVSYYKVTFKPGGQIESDEGYVHLFNSPMAAFQWIDATDPKDRNGTEPPTEHQKATARALIEGKATTVFYRGCDVTTNLTENK